jgi:phage gp37-like protein
MPVSSHLADLYAVIQTTIRAHFPADIVLEVSMHDGEWDVDEIETYSKKAPCIVVVGDGGKSQKTGNTIKELHRFDAYVMTRDRTVSSARLQRTRGALIIYEHLLRLLHSTYWNSDAHTYNAARPDKIESANLYNGKIGDVGVALWAVRWEQLIEIPADTDANDLDDFRTLYNTYTNFRPDTGIEDSEFDEQQIDLPGPFPP